MPHEPKPAKRHIVIHVAPGAAPAAPAALARRFLGFLSNAAKSFKPTVNLPCAACCNRQAEHTTDAQRDIQNQTCITRNLNVTQL